MSEVEAERHAEGTEPSHAKQRCACCLLMVLLALGGAGLGLSNWRMEGRAQADAVRDRLRDRWGPGELTTPPLEPEVDRLLAIALECDQLVVSDALDNLRGSSVTYVRAALKDPTTTSARVTYQAELPSDPPTLLGGIAALRSATATIDASLDLLDWSVIERQRLRHPRNAPKNDEDRYWAIHDLLSQLRDRALRASLAGDYARAWLELEHMVQTCLLLAEPTSLSSVQVTRLRMQVTIGALLEQLTEGPPPQKVARRIDAKLAELEPALDLRRPLLGALLQEEERLRDQPALAVEIATSKGRVYKKPQVSFGSRAKSVLVFDFWLRDYFLRAEQILNAADRHPRLLALLPEVEAYRDLPTTPFARGLQKSFPEMLKTSLSRLAELRIARLALAISRGAEVPELTDPWSEDGLPLRWEKRADGRLWLWSRGSDRRDDHAALSEQTQELEKDYPSSVLEQDPDMSYYDDQPLDLVRALPLGQ